MSNESVNSRGQPEASLPSSRAWPTVEGIDFAIAAAIVAAVVIVFYPSLSGKFVALDDFVYVANNDFVGHPGWATAKQVILEIGHPTSVHGYYQPLTVLSLMLDTVLSGGDVHDPFFYHLTNLILHGLNGVLVYFLIRAVVPHRGISLLLTTVFLFHPAQVESVSWIAQRKTPLSGLFCLASMLAYLHYGRQRRITSLFLCVAFVAIGNLAKPTALPMPVIFMLMDFWPLRRPFWKSLPEKAIFIPVILLSAWVAWISQASTVPMAAPRFASPIAFVEWAGYLCRNLMQQFGNLVWPIWLAPYRNVLDDWSLSQPATIAALIGGLAVIVVTLASLRFSRPLFVGLFGFLVLLSPSIGIVNYSGPSVADRFLYMPLSLLLLPAAAGLKRLIVISATAGGKHTNAPLRRGVAVSFMLVVIVVCVLLNRKQQAIWANSRVLWSHILEVAPNFSPANYNVAMYRLADGDAPGAEPPARRAVERDAANAKYRFLLGRICTRVGKPADARAFLESALKLGLESQQGYGWMALAEVAVVEGNVPLARQYIAKADQLGWNNPETIGFVAEIAIRVARNCDAAIEFSRLAVSRAPENDRVRLGLANCLAACGHPEEAIQEYEPLARRGRAGGLDVSGLERIIAALRSGAGPTSQPMPPNG